MAKLIEAVWYSDQTGGLGKVDMSLVDPHILLTLPAGPCF
jgi:hypothetical protein